jgi:hypothetical protein
MDEEKQKNVPVPAIIRLGKWLFQEDYWIPVILFASVMTGLILILTAVFNATEYDAKSILDGCKVVIENTTDCAALLAYLAG